MRSVEELIRISSQLDARFFEIRDGMAHDKEQSLRVLIRLLGESQTPYALIGGVAVQLWSSEPRTTLDIDIAVGSYNDLPTERLLVEGFQHQGRYEHSDNWEGPDGTPVQFSDDVAFGSAIATAELKAFGPEPLRVASPLELIRAKLRAVADPARRRRKRMQDWVDAQTLLDDYPMSEQSLTEEERELLRRGV